MALDPIQVQDALLALVQGSLTLGAYCKTVAVYQGGFSPEALATVGQVYRYPAALLVYDSSTGELNPSRVTRITERHNLLLADQNYRGIAGVLRGDAQNIGVHQMLIDARGLLLGKQLFSDASSLRFEGETLLYSDSSLVIYQSSYSIYYFHTV